jgi:hypothetical protein
LARQQIIVTDLTRMGDFDVCLAGVDPSNLRVCRRPLLASGPGRPTLHPDEKWLRSAKPTPIHLFSVVNLDDFGLRPDPPHIEDWVVSGRPAEVVSTLSTPQRRALLHEIASPSIDDLFGAPVRWTERDEGLRTGGSVQPGEGNASLGTLNVELERFRIVQNDSGKIAYYVYFRDEAGTRNRLTVTDLTFRGWADAVRRLRGGSFEELNKELHQTFQPHVDLWLRIGLARPWSPSRDQTASCFLQVTGVHSVPDYLEGATWTDFRLHPV